MMVGSILISKKRITAFAYSSPILNLELKDERIKKIDYSGSTDQVLSMEFDAATFSDDSSGMVTYLFYTPKAKEILQNINENYWGKPITGSESRSSNSPIKLKALNSCHERFQVGLVCL